MRRAVLLNKIVRITCTRAKIIHMRFPLSVYITHTHSNVFKYLNTLVCSFTLFKFHLKHKPDHHRSLLERKPLKYVYFVHAFSTGVVYVCLSTPIFHIHMNIYTDMGILHFCASSTGASTLIIISIVCALCSRGRIALHNGGVFINLKTAHFNNFYMNISISLLRRGGKL